MATEIEHKYLVRNDTYRAMAVRQRRIAQGYLSRDPERTVRVRIDDAGAWLTVKGRTEQASRLEFEYEIPRADAEAMLALCAGKIVEKVRYIVPFAGYTWEVDEFLGSLAPLVVAEIELAQPGHDYPLPPFVGEEVTTDQRYYNSNL